MPRYQKRPLLRNCQPNILNWCRERELRATNRAARKLAQRYRISIHHAAELAAAGGVGEGLQ